MRKIFLMVLFFYINTISSAEVSFEQLLNASKDPENWLTYSGTYRSERFALQDQINISNVNQLKTIWAYQKQPSKISGSGLVETTPIVANEIMYITIYGAIINIVLNILLIPYFNLLGAVYAKIIALIFI